MSTAVPAPHPAPAAPVTDAGVAPATAGRPAASGLPAPAVLAVAVGAGLAVGALTSVGQTLLGGTAFAGLANAVSPWLVASFLVGALARRGWVAALAGLLACAGEVAGYYLVADLRGFAVSASSVAVWVVAGVLGGPVFGWAGRLWRTATGTWRGLGPALLVGCWLAEAVVTYAVVLRYGDDAAVFAVVAALLVVLLGRVGGQTVALLRWLPAATVVGAAGFAAVHLALG
ncbi:DUF6518 family protein [Cellulomonas sp. Y8]|uniref:DUF6518 family protein n=1 Tax=Cellulomonas sp. Y8 TaxID=2591145 RepID=UPI0011C8B25F|nr:DUF6518 family protein [Cellulomonas sp. Y8]